MTTRWVLRIPEAAFFVNKTNGEKGEIEELFVDVAEGRESAVFLSMTKQLQGAMMKTARSALPVKTVPLPSIERPAVLSKRQETMPAMPIAGPGAGAPTPEHKTMPVRPPMSPSAIKRTKNAPSPSFGRLKHEQDLIQQKKNQSKGLSHPSNKVIPNSFERLTSETAARHQPAPPAVELNEEVNLGQEVQTSHEVTAHE